MLDYPVDEAVLQVFDAPQPNERQRSPMLNVVAAPARALRDLATLVRKAGLVPESHRCRICDSRSRLDRQQLDGPGRYDFSDGDISCTALQVTEGAAVYSMFDIDAVATHGTYGHAELHPTRFARPLQQPLM